MCIVDATQKTSPGEREIERERERVREVQPGGAICFQRMCNTEKL